jgi:hypothetical protein
MARAIAHLWKSVQRIDVVYICSNTDIARQNVQRLSISGCEIAAQATRLTFMHDLGRHRVNIVALTPATSFEQTGGCRRTAPPGRVPTIAESLIDRLKLP